MFTLRIKNVGPLFFSLENPMNFLADKITRMHGYQALLTFRNLEGHHMGRIRRAYLDANLEAFKERTGDMMEWISSYYDMGFQEADTVIATLDKMIDQA